ncbi:MAG: HAD-IIIC family phosphatase [Planctomycetota bacterium]|jgi:FkbH-like protein|nr:HAD-IIIC family phosphatase [Planctomycetota bacterium]
MRESYGRPWLDERAPIPADVDAARLERTRPPELRSTLVWSEHCTECAMPACYASCDLYHPRHDLHCRRFVTDIATTPAEGAGGEWMTVRLRRWARLQAEGIPSLFHPRRAARIEAVDRRLSRLLNGAPLSHGVRMRLVNLWTRTKGSAFHRARSADASAATHFACEALNHGADTVTLLLTIRQQSRPDHHLPHRIELRPGYNLDLLPTIEFFAGLRHDERFFVHLDQEGDEGGAHLSFGTLDFVRAAAGGGRAESSDSDAPSEHAKCVVWDLDNTLWDGILVEDGPDALRPRPRVLETIAELDRRGILNSIASKNQPHAAEAVLRDLGIWELFVFPQISWGPKSEAVRRIQGALDIGIDTFVFVDDQAFERAEVAAALPAVRVLDEAGGAELDAAACCDVPRTPESARRRRFYQEQIRRDDAAPTSEAGYAEFLRSCGLVMEIEHLGAARLERVFELVQRTNQMNFSGRRYSRSQLAELADDPRRTCLVIRCEDRFGDYGVIGFAIFHEDEACLEDLMFSCRIQSKRVEHHFIAYLAQRAARSGAAALRARYRATERNAPSGKVFGDLGFEVLQTTDGVQDLLLDVASFELDERVIEVRESTVARTDGA